MHKILTTFSALLLGFALGASDAEAARRLGGGKSLGQQRESIQREQVAPKPPQAPAGVPQSAPGPRPGFGGMLGGLLAGGLIGALLFGGAFDGIKMGDVLMIAALAFAALLLFRTFGRSRTLANGNLQPAGSPGLRRVEPHGPIANREAATLPTAAAPATTARNIPADFDADGFLKHARRAFVQLQAANDARDLTAIRDYTTPELYAALESEIRDRPPGPQQVNAVTLDAKLLDVSTENNVATASVLFSGYLREDGDGLPQEFEEIWHVTKNLADAKSVWLLAGIQQVA
jgi:predicted lipid-binding transport protein (Tim44 family)